MVEPYGGMTQAGAESRANYLLKWEAIRRSAEAGASVYDMWGLAHAGIEQFKAGFGGREANYVGAFDLVDDPAAARRRWSPGPARLGARRAAASTPRVTGLRPGAAVCDRAEGAPAMR